MYIRSIIVIIFITFLTQMAQAEDRKFSLVIHGGAGKITRETMSEKNEAKYTAKLLEALEAGRKILAEGGNSLDAISAAIMVMEDSPLFNAGKGAVFDAAGKNMLDAAIMEGKTLNAGAVAGVTKIKNPILLTRAVMDKSPHVMMIGEGAEQFAHEIGIEMVDPSYFYTEKRWQGLQKVLESRKTKNTALLAKDVDYKYGTVGAVAIDQHGNIAAGTSSGGMTAKLYGRVGDVPIIGAGTYANNSSCGVSATGHGEYFIRATVARNICALMEYKGLSLAEAADQIVMHQLVEMKGSGGIIAVDKDGNTALVFNTSGMFRGSVTSQSPATVAMFQQ